MSERMHLITMGDYKRLVETVRSYEAALARTYAGGSGAGLAAMLEQLREAVNAASVSVAVVDQGAYQAVKEAVHQLKAERPSEYEAVRRLWQAIGVSAEESGTLAERLGPYLVAASPVLGAYRQAAEKGLGIVVLPTEQ